MGYEELARATQRLRRYRHFQTFTAGRSLLGRPLHVYVVGSGRPRILICGAHHALEYVTAMLCVQFAQELCEHLHTGEPLGGQNVASLLDGASVCILPMLNPDGVELHLRGLATAGPLREQLRRMGGGGGGRAADFSHWQANAHGVDLNHNYNAGWPIVHRLEQEAGITLPGPTRYGGARPESEPETQALCNLCRRLQFQRAYALHSQGEEIYWSYGAQTPKNAYDLACALGAASGYMPSQPEELASHGGFKDWFISVFHRPAFTIEVGRGVNPLPVEDFAAIYERILPMLLLMLAI